MSDPKLFTPLQAGALRLKNRVVMAPLTRNRARPADDVPGPLAAEYYRQRASAGLIISEGTQISPRARATPSPPASTARRRWRAGRA